MKPNEIIVIFCHPGIIFHTKYNDFLYNIHIFYMHKNSITKMTLISICLLCLLCLSMGGNQTWAENRENAA